MFRGPPNLFPGYLKAPSPLTQLFGCSFRCWNYLYIAIEELKIQTSIKLKIDSFFFRFTTLSAEATILPDGIRLGVESAVSYTVSP